MFATTNLYRVLLPSIGCFLLFSSFLLLQSSEWTSYCSAYQFPKPILSASSWHIYYTILWEVCQVFFQTFFKNLWGGGFEPPQAVYTATLSDTISHNREALINWLGLFTTGSASLSYLTEALVHIYIPQPRGDLAVRCLYRGGLTHSRGCCPFFRVAFPHLCVLIIAHLLGFVKGFSTFSRNFFFERPYARATLTMASIRLRRPSPLDILIIAHLVPFVKRFFGLNAILFQFKCPLPFGKSERNYLFRFDAPLSSWHTYYSTSCTICQGVFEKNRNFFSKAIPYPLWVRLRHTESSVLYPNGAGLKSVQCLTLLTLLL